MITIRNIFLTIILCLGSMVCQAQKVFSSDVLDGTTWVPAIQPPVCIDTITYSASKETVKAYFPLLNKTVVGSEDYYFARTVPSAFDHSQANRTSVGCYVIYYNALLDEMSFNRIIELDIDKGVFILERYNSLTGFEPVEYNLVKE